MLHSDCVNSSVPLWQLLVLAAAVHTKLSMVVSSDLLAYCNCSLCNCWVTCYCYTHIQQRDALQGQYKGKPVDDLDDDELRELCGVMQRSTNGSRKTLKDRAVK
jgi:hypothetical protein